LRAQVRLSSYSSWDESLYFIRVGKKESFYYLKIWYISHANEEHKDIGNFPVISKLFLQPSPCFRSGTIPRTLMEGNETFRKLGMCSGLWVPGQPGLHSKNLSPRPQKKLSMCSK
jgi:hypothetical protein